MSHKCDIGGCRAEPSTQIIKMEYKLGQCLNTIHHMCSTEPLETIKLADRSSTFSDKTRSFCLIKCAKIFFNSIVENEAIRNNSAGADKRTEDTSGKVSTNTDQKSITSCGKSQSTI